MFMKSNFLNARQFNNFMAMAFRLSFILNCVSKLWRVNNKEGRVTDFVWKGAKRKKAHSDRSREQCGSLVWHIKGWFEKQILLIISISPPNYWEKVKFWSNFWQKGENSDPLSSKLFPCNNKIILLHTGLDCAFNQVSGGRRHIAPGRLLHLRPPIYSSNKYKHHRVFQVTC